MKKIMTVILAVTISHVGFSQGGSVGGGRNRSKPISFDGGGSVRGGFVEGGSNRRQDKMSSSQGGAGSHGLFGKTIRNSKGNGLVSGGSGSGHEGHEGHGRVAYYFGGGGHVGGIIDKGGHGSNGLIKTRGNNTLSIAC